MSSAELHPHKATLDKALEVCAQLQQQLQRTSTEEELVQIHGISDKGAQTFAGHCARCWLDQGQEQGELLLLLLFTLLLLPLVAHSLAPLVVKSA